MKPVALVAVDEAEIIIGFADMASDGYLDRLYVSAAHQREGVGKRLVAALEQRVASPQYKAYVSITAQPFFKTVGYSTIREHRAFIGTTSFRNYLMGKRCECESDWLRAALMA